MAVYDNNGTANAEIGKLYDNDGTTNHQIGKVYDNNGTTNSLVYQNAVDPFTFLNYSSKILDTNYTVAPSSYNVRIEDDPMSGAYGYLFTHYAIGSPSSMRWNTPRDLTGLTKITISVGYLSGSAENCYFGISKDATLAYYDDVVGTVFPNNTSRKVHISKTGTTHQTYTLNITGVEGLYYFKFTIKSTKNETTPQCYIKSITVS